MSFSVYEADAGSDTDRRSGVIDRITTIQSTTKTTKQLYVSCRLFVNAMGWPHRPTRLLSAPREPEPMPQPPRSSVGASTSRRS